MYFSTAYVVLQVTSVFKNRILQVYISFLDLQAYNKGKGVLVQVMKAYRRMEIQILSFLTPTH